MRNDTEYVAYVQRQKQKKYPKDRIAFYGSCWAVKLDKHCFEKYLRKEISLKHACLQMAINNYLPVVTPEQFLNELRICGYERENDKQRSS